jgi:hypothetical protein
MPMADQSIEDAELLSVYNASRARYFRRVAPIIGLSWSVTGAVGAFFFFHGGAGWVRALLGSVILGALGIATIRAATSPRIELPRTVRRRLGRDTA